jgi:uncharacterized protein (TIGR02145 family)
MDPNYTNETVRDLDGNSYHVVRIGTQEWFIENLKTIRYRNGDIIGTTNPATKKFGLFDLKPKYQWSYQGKEEYINTFGRLYTWYAATDPRGIAPKGWRIPSKADFEKLIGFLQNNGYHFRYEKHEIGKSMASKENWGKDRFGLNTLGQIGSFLDLNNSSGFTAQPGGKRSESNLLQAGQFYGIFEDGYWWTSSEALNNNSESIAVELTCWGANPQFNDHIKHNGFSIRCLRDI